MPKIETIRSSQSEAPLAFFCKKEKENCTAARYGPVIRDVYLFECCTGGRGAIIVNGKEFHVKKGSFYVLFPGDSVVHVSKLDSPRRGYSCVASGISLRRILSRAGITSDQPFAPAKLFPALLEAMEKMYGMEGESDPGAECRRTGYLYRILGELLREGEVETGESLIQKALGIMEARYHEGLTVAILSREVGLDRSYFSTVFKKAMGISPHRYLTDLRIRKACALMKRSDLPIAVVAEAVGLDPQNFSRFFQRETGLTPSQYQKGK